MENKITVLTLASSLSKTTGKTKKVCEDFIREYFRLASECMEEGEVLKIKGFGTFKVVDVEGRTSVNVNTGQRQEIPPYKKVVFTPTKDFARIINSPFEEFESVELEEEIPDEVLYEEVSEEEISDENNVSMPRLEEGSGEENEDDDITAEAYNIIEEKETEETSVPESEGDKSDEESETSKDETDENKEEIAFGEGEEENEVSASQNIETPTIYPIEKTYYEPRTPSRFGIGFLTGALSALVVCVVIFMLGCFFDWWPENFLRGEKNIEIVEVPEVPEQSIEEPEAEVEAEPVYDTVSTTRYLTTIAREHYGDFNFWPYIYMENESKLGHPDRITPGTKVVVPDLKKYGVEVGNPQDVENAKAEGKKIYARYNKK